MLVLGNPALAQKRIALVIGNSAYGEEIGNLKNPENDARDIANALVALGFSVTKKFNADKRQMRQAINQFGKQLAQPNSVGLFYFAGHGVQVKNRNYLIPVGAAIDGETDVEYEAIDAGRILGKMEAAGNSLNLVILDACRDNPFDGSFRAAYSRGLTRIPVPRGSMILYAASPGEKAADGQGRNGVFTQNLLQKLNQPGLTVDQVFKQTAEAVYSATGRKQLPYREGSIIGEFYFRLTRINKSTSPTPSPMVSLASTEDIFIQYMDKDDQIQIQTYLDEYPQGKLAVLFRAKLKKFEISEYTLTVRSNVNGDTVYIDGKNYGTTRLDVKLPPGEYTLKIEKEGYETFEQMLQLASNQTVRGVLKKEALPLKYAGQVKQGQTWTDPNTRMKFVWVPKGCFQMGSRLGDGDEKPVHEVCVDGYWLGQTEVTQGQWKKLMRNNPAHFASNGGVFSDGDCDDETCPVEQVSWDDTQAFIRKLNAQSSKTYRLPTEAEWEYACRSGGKNQKYAGRNSANSAVWYEGNADRKTHPVGQKDGNGLGLYDMSGNVWEWVQDDYSDSAYRSHGRHNPIYDAGGQDRVIRGGSWNDGASRSRCTARDDSTSDDSDYFLGFRLLRAL